MSAPAGGRSALAMRLVASIAREQTRRATKLQRSPITTSPTTGQSWEDDDPGTFSPSVEVDGWTPWFDDKAGNSISLYVGMPDTDFEASRVVLDGQEYDGGGAVEVTTPFYGK